MGLALIRANRSYRLFLSGAAVSNLADGVAVVALPWLATLFTRDPLLIALVAAAGRAPWALMILPAGVITDRADRRRLMLRADLMRAVLMLGVVALALSVPPLSVPSDAATGSVVGLAVLAFLLGAAEVLRDNAAQTMLPAVVDPASLERANGTLWTVEHLTGRFLGPPLAGLLIGLGVAVPFGFDALAFAVAAACLWLIVLPPRPRPARRGVWTAFREGAGWLWGQPFLMRLAVVLGLMNLCAMMVLTVLVLHAQERLGLSAQGYGLLLAAGATGAVAGGVLAPGLAARMGLRPAMLAGMAAVVLPWPVLAATTSPVVTAVCLMVEGAGGMLWNVVTVSHRQRLIPDAILGRVNSLYRFFAWGTLPVGALLAGALVSAAEPVLGRAAAVALPFAVAGAGGGGLWLYALCCLRPREGVS
jgi:MFS family permease